MKMLIILVVGTPTPPIWLTLLIDFKWPIVVIIITLIFFRTFKNLLQRFNKGKILGAELELDNTPQSKQQDTEVKKEFTTLEKSVAFFNDATISHFGDFVTKESEIENITSNESKINNLIKYCSILYIKYVFDQLYDMIFGSQLKMLLHLNTVIGIGETYEALKYFFDKAAEENPAAYEGYAYEDYFQFLIRRNLVIKKDDKYIITVLGVDFIKYIPETKKNYNRPF